MDQTFTQDQVNQMIEEAKKEIEKELRSVIQERDELLQFKPKTLTDEEKVIQQKQAELLQKEMVLLMKEAEVSDFADIITANDAEEMKAKIGKLKDVLKARKVDTSFKPDNNHKQQSAYDIAEKNNDVVGMIDSKLQNLFK